MVDLAPANRKARLAALADATRIAVDSVRRLLGDHNSLPRSLGVATGAVAAALLLSLFLSHVAHLPLPVSAQVPFYLAIFIAARLRGLLAGIAALLLALGVSDFFVAEPLYVLLPIYDMPDFLVFGLAAAGSLGVGYLGRKLAGGAAS